MLSLAIAVWLLGRPGRLRSVVIYAGAACLAACLFFGSFFLAKSAAEDRIEAIVVAEKVLVGFDASELEQALNCLKNRTPV